MEAAVAVAGVATTLVFVVDPADETVPIFLAHPRDVITLFVREPDPYVERQWNSEARLRHMVVLRNRLLDCARGLQPDAFVSVDSDVLLHPSALAELLEGIGRFDAVGGGTFMDAPPRFPSRFPVGHHYPSCGWVTGHGGLIRRPIEHQGVIPVGVIMAVKAMAPAAYAVDYEYNPHGEDVGWSVACARAGVCLGWDNRHPSKHVMRSEALDVVDERCGF